MLVTANAGQHCHSLADASGDSPTSGLTFSKSTRFSGAKIPIAFGTGTSIMADASGRPRLFEIQIAKGRVFPVQLCLLRCTERIAVADIETVAPADTEIFRSITGRIGSTRLNIEVTLHSDQRCPCNTGLASIFAARSVHRKRPTCETLCNEG